MSLRCDCGEMVATCEELTSTWPTIAASALVTMIAMGYAAAWTVAQALDRLRGDDSDDETPPPEGVYS
eukprot:COSAG02_NODE_1483_length_12385_cov_116.196565_6_plen_68_part_00